MNNDGEDREVRLIVYACPTGKLNSQIENYLIRAKQLYGENAAHKYMPHCTLTGFFCDRSSSIPNYIDALTTAYRKIEQDNLYLDIKIKQLTFNDNWHGLELQADNWKRLIADFVAIESSTTRLENIRLKDWLHLSLAYDFNPKYRTQLQELAISSIDLAAEVNWELRFYQNNLDWSWQCLKSWK